MLTLFQYCSFFICLWYGEVNFRFLEGFRVGVGEWHDVSCLSFDFGAQIEMLIGPHKMLSGCLFR